MDDTPCEKLIKDEKLTVTVPVVIPLDRLLDLLTSAFEGGSNYWILRIHDTQEDWNPPKGRAKYLQEIPFLGGTVTIEPNEDPGETKIPTTELTVIEDEEVEDGSNMRVAKIWKLDYGAIVKGIETMANLKKGEGGHHWPNFLNEDDDAETGDVFLQCCLFGEIMFS